LGKAMRDCELFVYDGANLIGLSVDDADAISQAAVVRGKFKAELLVTPNTSRIVGRIVAVDDEILRELERRTRPRMKGPRPAISFKRVSGS